MGCPPIDKYIISTYPAGKRRASGGQADAIIIIIACDNINMIIATFRILLAGLQPKGNHGTKLIRAPLGGRRERQEGGGCAAQWRRGSASPLSRSDDAPCREGGRGAFERSERPPLCSSEASDRRFVRAKRATAALFERSERPPFRGGIGKASRNVCGAGCRCRPDKSSEASDRRSNRAKRATAV